MKKEDERTIILAKANAIIYFSDLIAKYHNSDFIAEFARKVINPMFLLLRTNLGTFEVDNDDQHDSHSHKPAVCNSRLQQFEGCANRRWIGGQISGVRSRYRVLGVAVDNSKSEEKGHCLCDCARWPP